MSKIVASDEAALEGLLNILHHCRGLCFAIDGPDGLVEISITGTGEDRIGPYVEGSTFDDGQDWTGPVKRAHLDASTLITYL